VDNKKVAIDKEKFGFEPEKPSRDNKLANGGIPGYDKTWYKEVVELRKKAGQYKVSSSRHCLFSFLQALTFPQSRGWGIEINNDLYKKQMDLWDQVSMRSSLSALSLASAVRPITKEEKELENEKKSSPTKPAGRSRFPGQARLVDNKAVTDAITLGKIKRDAIRHHLERTTGPGNRRLVIDFEVFNSYFWSPL
jgi:Nuclear protein MDM1